MVLDVLAWVFQGVCDLVFYRSASTRGEAPDEAEIHRRHVERARRRMEEGLRRRKQPPGESRSAGERPEKT